METVKLYIQNNCYSNFKRVSARFKVCRSAFSNASQLITVLCSFSYTYFSNFCFVFVFLESHSRSVSIIRSQSNIFGFSQSQMSQKGDRQSPSTRDLLETSSPSTRDLLETSSRKSRLDIPPFSPGESNLFGSEFLLPRSDFPLQRSDFPLQSRKNGELKRDALVDAGYGTRPVILPHRHPFRSCCRHAANQPDRLLLRARFSFTIANLS